MGERRDRIVAQLAAPYGAGRQTKRLCDVSAQVTAMSGAGIMLMSGEVPRGSVCTTNAVSALIEELQYALGEGPCVDAYRGDTPVFEADLAGRVETRWPAFSGPAIDAGVRAVFGFPLRVGSARLGALNLYRDKPGPLSDDQYANALVMADVAAEAVLLMQANAAPGRIDTELGANANFQTVVHQATGMVAAQLESTVTQALIRLRAYAFGNDQSLAEVAEAVVARTLRLDHSDDGTSAP